MRKKKENKRNFFHNCTKKRSQLFLYNSFKISNEKLLSIARPLSHMLLPIVPKIPHCFEIHDELETINSKKKLNVILHHLPDVKNKRALSRNIDRINRIKDDLRSSRKVADNNLMKVNFR